MDPSYGQADSVQGITVFPGAPPPSSASSVSSAPVVSPTVFVADSLFLNHIRQQVDSLASYIDKARTVVDSPEVRTMIEELGDQVREKITNSSIAPEVSQEAFALINGVSTKFDEKIQEGKASLSSRPTTPSPTSASSAIKEAMQAAQKLQEAQPSHPSFADRIKKGLSSEDPKEIQQLISDLTKKRGVGSDEDRDNLEERLELLTKKSSTESAPSSSASGFPGVEESQSPLISERVNLGEVPVPSNIPEQTVVQLPLSPIPFSILHTASPQTTLDGSGSDVEDAPPPSSLEEDLEVDPAADRQAIDDAQKVRVALADGNITATEAKQKLIEIGDRPGLKDRTNEAILAWTNDGLLGSDTDLRTPESSLYSPLVGGPKMNKAENPRSKILSMLGGMLMTAGAILTATGVGALVGIGMITLGAVLSAAGISSTSNKKDAEKSLLYSLAGITGLGALGVGAYEGYKAIDERRS